MTQLSLPGIPSVHRARCQPWSLRRRLSRTGKHNGNYRHGRITRTRLSLETHVVRALNTLKQQWQIGFSRQDLIPAISELSASACALHAVAFSNRDRTGAVLRLYLPRAAWGLARLVLAIFARLQRAMSPRPSSLFLTTGNPRTKNDFISSFEDHKQEELKRFWTRVNQEA